MSRENERIKLKATFWNNLAVAAVVTGVVVPVIGVYQDDNLWNAPVFSGLAWRFIVALTPAIIFAFAFRAYANYLMTTLTED
jgi:hypothetical protein